MVAYKYHLSRTYNCYVFHLNEQHIPIVTVTCYIIRQKILLFHHVRDKKMILLHNHSVAHKISI